MCSNKTSSFSGLVAATVTPMHDDGSINMSVIPRYIDHLLSTGVKGVFVNGSTGEWSSLTVEERKGLVEAWMKHGRGKLDNIMVHCGAYSIEDAKELAKHAEEHGADAIGCIAPCFLKPSTDAHLVEYLAEVASAAPSTPFLYYHIPVLTNVHINMAGFLTHAHQKIPTFSGLKVTTQDFHEVYHCLKFTGKKLSIYYGVDFQFLQALVMGVKSAVGSFYNFLGKQFNDIIDDYNNGRLNSAREKQIKVAMEINTLYKKHGVGMTKVLTSLVSGIEIGPCRLPLKQKFTEAEVRGFHMFLQENGYLKM